MRSVNAFLTKINTIHLILFLVVGQNIISFSQLNISTFEEFTQIRNNPYLINPASSDTSYRLKCSANLLQDLGFFKGVYKSYLDVDKRLRSKSKLQNNWIGFQFTNSTYGEYIHKNRFSLRYSWSTPLNYNLLLSTGASLGVVNFAFLTSQGGGGDSDFDMDGSLGIRLISKKGQLGISSQHIFNSEIPPLNDSYKSPRLFLAEYFRNYSISMDLNLRGALIAQYSELKEKYASFAMDLDWKKIYSVGYTYHSMHRSSFQAGLLCFSYNQLDFSTQFVYSIYHINGRNSSDALEIYISVFY